MNDAYQIHLKERQEQGIPPLPLNKNQTEFLIQELSSSRADQELLTLLEQRVNPGVDPAAQVKADFLVRITQNKISCSVISPERATEILGTMVGGFNLEGLIQLIVEKSTLSNIAAKALKKAVLSINIFDKIQKLAEQNNTLAQEIIESWANAEWFTETEKVPEQVTTVIYKVNGEINTDDFSPAAHAFTRADIPLHSLCMGGVLFPDGLQEISNLKSEYNLPICFVGDVVGTGSSRKSACNSLLWHIGEEIPFIPNKKRKGFILGGIIAPIFFNTAEDSGAFPIQTDVSKLITGQQITICPYEGKIVNSQTQEILSQFEITPNTLFDEYRSGGRVPYIIGKQLTEKARVYLKLSLVKDSEIFAISQTPKLDKNQGYTLAQKMLGKACGEEGILPGTSCLPKMTTVGSQDTTGPMTANEITELACLRFNADLVMQSFCHTAAYPKPSDVLTHATLPSYISSRGGVSLKPGDGIIHSWLNRLLIPDTVGTGGDSHTRFPLGISFPAGSGLVAFAAALGVMPLDMPESVLVRFKGELQLGITLRDVVNAIPHKAIEKGLLTVEKKNKKNVFSGRILEMEGLSNLKLEQAFELTDAAAERSAAAATIKLNRESIEEYLLSNIKLMETMIKSGYQDSETLQRRIDSVKEWLKNGELMESDENALYTEIIEIDLNELKEPIVACPNDPDDVKKLSEVSGDIVNEVFIGSCMTNIGHFRSAAKVLEDQGQTNTILWICPPTQMDETQLKAEGYFSIFSAAGARLEVPGCSLCMGNQARVKDGATVFSTSTRNFNNRLGKDARVYLGSSELAAVVALLGKIPTVEEYQQVMKDKIAVLDQNEVYKYLNFHLMEDFSLS